MWIKGRERRRGDREREREGGGEREGESEGERASERERERLNPWLCVRLSGVGHQIAVQKSRCRSLPEIPKS